MRRISVRSLSRWVWLFNGLILLAVLVGTGVALLGSWILHGGDRTVAVAEADSAAALPARPAVRLDPPLPVAGSEVRLALVRQGGGLPGGPAPGPAYRGAGAIVNVAFLQPDGSARLLLDQPARIGWIAFPGAPEWLAGPLSTGPAARRIAYALAEEGPGGAEPRLYLSGLDGSGMRPALPPGLAIQSMTPLDPGRWLITALERGTDGGPRRQRAFVLAGDSVTLHPALDSAAAVAAAVEARRGPPGVAEP